MSDVFVDNSTSSNVTEPAYTDLQSNFITGFSVLSAFTSSFYVITYIVFMSDMKKKTSYEILFYIFISNVLTSLGSSKMHILLP